MGGIFKYIDDFSPFGFRREICTCKFSLKKKKKTSTLYNNVTSELLNAVDFYTGESWVLP